MLLNSRIFVSVLIPVSIMAGLPVSANDDAYLKMLENEAANVQLDHNGRLEQENKQRSVETVFEWNGEIEERSLPKGLGKEEFETFLQKYYYGTYTFFNKLNSTDKETVYYRYSKADIPGLENVRQNVMALLKQ